MKHLTKACVLLLLFAACGGSAAVQHDISGRVVVAQCAIGTLEGGGVTAKDQSGKILAVGTMHADGKPCEMSFKMNNLPKRSFYAFSVETVQGDVNYSYAQMNQKHWKVYLNTGI